jgi:hypothetical protein
VSTVGVLTLKSLIALAEGSQKAPPTRRQVADVRFRAQIVSGGRRGASVSTALSHIAFI